MLDIKYNKFLLELPPKANFNYAINRISELRGVVVVNIADSVNGQTMLFTADNMQFLLSQDISQLYVETISENQYRMLVCQVLSQILINSEKLQNELRSKYVVNLFTPMTEFISHLQHATNMLTCFVLPQRQIALNKEIDKLRNLQGQLGQSGFYFEDNVRCLDDLQYGIIPCLRQIINSLKA